jgi:hypothetical protein
MYACMYVYMKYCESVSVEQLNYIYIYIMQVYANITEAQIRLYLPNKVK